jgi:hypothetical protein
MDYRTLCETKSTQKTFDEIQRERERKIALQRGREIKCDSERERERMRGAECKFAS